MIYFVAGGNDKDGKGAEIPHIVKYLLSGLSGCGATVVCHPIDVIKNRMQLSGERGVKKEHKTSLHAAHSVITKEGWLSLYNGFSANIARQLAYTMTRLGTYQVCIEHFEDRGITGLKAQVGSSLIAGFVASIVATPTDVALIRMTADNRLPEAERRNYRHVIDALNRMAREEGLSALYAGVVPSVLRAMLGNLTQLVSYVQTKHYLIDKGYMEDGAKLHLGASLISGLIYAFSTTPLDVAKTRMQTMKIVDGVPEYKNLRDVWSSIYHKEGITAFWKGFSPYYFKIAPNTVLLFMFNEKLIYLYKKFILKDPDAKGGL